MLRGPSSQSKHAFFNQSGAETNLILTQRRQISLRLAPVAPFFRANTGCKFSRTLAPGAPFSRANTGCKFSRALHRVQMFVSRSDGLIASFDLFGFGFTTVT